MNTIHRPLRAHRALSLFAFLASTFIVFAAPPSITQQPAVVTAIAGGSASFTVVANAEAPVTYQWRHLGVPLGGADAATLSIPAVALTDAGFYDVVVTAAGERTVSQAGRLLVQPSVVADTFRADPNFALVAEMAGGEVNVVRLTTAGKLLVGGSFTTIAGLRRDGLARLDGNFIYDGFAPVVSGAVFAIAEQGDGRILIGGGFTHVNGVPRSCIARLNADGTLDPTFFPGTGFNGNAYAIVVQPDGRIVVGGSFTSADGSPCGRIARLNADGSLDSSFVTGTGFDATVRSIALQSTGRLVVGGFFSHCDGQTAGRLARLHINGVFDASFALGSGCNATVLALSVVSTSDDRLFVAGAFTNYAGDAANRLMRLTADGMRDDTFAAPAGINGAVRALAPTAAGLVVIGGDFTSTTPTRCVARLDANGTVDPDWAPPVSARPASSVFAVASDSDGRLVAGGGFTQIGTTAGTASGLVRYSSDGKSNTAPLGALRQPASINAAVPVSEGRWVVGGSFTHLNGEVRNRIARIAANGALDPTFDPGTGFNGAVTTIVRQGDGRILVGGGFTLFNGNPAVSVVRLESTGVRDTGFALDPGIAGTVTALALQPDGWILVGGDFSQNSGSSRNNLARLRVTGDLDPTFDTGPGQSGPVNALAVQRDGRIVAGGVFTQFNALPRGGAARFTAAGALDTTFNAGAGFSGAINTLAIRADDSLVLGGAFLSFDGAPRRGLAGLADSGSLIAEYNSGAVLGDGPVQGSAALPDGRVLAVGSFTGWAGPSAAGLARLSAAGTADPGFAAYDRSLGINFGVIAAADGSILILGPTAARGNARQVGLVVLRPEVAPLPVIATAPVTQTVVEGGDVVFTVVASGSAPLRYQWLKNGEPLVGENAAALSFSDVLPADSASYSVIVRNDYGSANAAAVLTVASAGSYLGWAVAHFLPGELLLPAVSGPAADPDGAGVTNLVRYAFGLPARGPVAAPTSVITVVDGGLNYLAVQFTRAAVSDDLLYTVQASGNLVDWRDVAVLSAGVPIEQTVRDTVATSAAPRRFLRVKIELVP